MTASKTIETALTGVDKMFTYIDRGQREVIKTALDFKEIGGEIVI